MRFSVVTSKHVVSASGQSQQPHINQATNEGLKKETRRLCHQAATLNHESLLLIIWSEKSFEGISTIG